MASEIFRSIRMTPAELESVLAELDARANNAATGDRSRREHSRMEYRLHDVLVEIRHPGQTNARYLVATRNLSAGGLAFLHGGFLHAGTTCYVVLTDVEGNRVGLRGEVRTCRHVSRSLHEVGVKFVQRIDTKRFCGTAAKVTSNDPELLEMRLPHLQGQALLVSARAETRRAITAQLAATGLTVAPTESIGDAADRIKQVAFDIVVLDGAWEKGRGLEAVRGVRKAGYAGPLLCIAEEPERARLTADGEVAGVLAHPVGAEVLIGTVAALMEDLGEDASQRPVYSLLAGTRSMADSIERFVEEARQAGEAMCHELESERWDRVRELCEMLRRAGSQNGFAVVGEAARRIIALLNSDDQGAMMEVPASVYFLSQLCGRLRAGRDAAHGGDAPEQGSIGRAA